MRARPILTVASEHMYGIKKGSRNWDYWSYQAHQAEIHLVGWKVRTWCHISSLLGVGRHLSIKVHACLHQPMKFTPFPFSGWLAARSRRDLENGG